MLLDLLTNWNISSQEPTAPHIFNFLVLVALTRAIKRQAPANIEPYLWVIAVQILGNTAVHLGYGDWSWQYLCTYAGFDAFILWFVCRITLDCLSTRERRFRACVAVLILAACLTKLAFLGAQGHVDRFLAISLVEGFILVWAGTLTLFAGAHTRRPDLYCTLGAFWLAQAWYSFGWTIKFQEWADINWVLPPLMAIGCFGYLARRLRLRPVEA